MRRDVIRSRTRSDSKKKKKKISRPDPTHNCRLIRARIYCQDELLIVRGATRIDEGRVRAISSKFRILA